MQDEIILELLSRRDEQALVYVAEKYRGYLFGIAKNILGSDADSEECVNDAIYRTWASTPPCPTDLKAYLAKAVRNVALDRYRRERAVFRDVHLRVVMNELDECVPIQRMDETFDKVALRELLNVFLEELSEADRSLFIARYFRAETVSKIAKDHGMGESRVKMRLSRARKKLKDMLKKESIDT
jgi:RNA polymerase sigma-70 factor (ECF subfamily)